MTSDERLVVDRKGGRPCRLMTATAWLSLVCAVAAAGETQAPAFRWRKVAEVEKAERVFPSAVDSNTVFVWTRGGLLVSKDCGVTFALRGKDAAAQLGSLTELLISPIRPATLYAGTLEKGVFLSDDEGATWRPLGGVDKGLGSLRIHTLLFSTSDPTFTTLYATHSPQQPGISTTIDGGQTWRVFAQEFGAGDLLLAGTTMFIAGSRPAGGGDAGFYRSLDAGKNWYRILNVEGPTALVGSMARQRRAWCGTQSGLFVTDDFGVSTRAVGPQTGMNIASIAPGYSVGGDELMYAYDPNTEGVLASTDGFKTWQKLSEGLYVGDWVAEGATMAAAGNVLFACINNTLYRGAPAAGPARLSSVRVEPAAAVAGTDAVTFTCRAAAGAQVTIDLSCLGGDAATPLLDDGKNGDGAAGDGVFGLRLEKIGLEVLAKARDKDYTGPRLPGAVALAVRATAGGTTENGCALLTVLQSAVNVTLWNGESRNETMIRSEEGVSLEACQEHPFSGETHLRLRVSDAGRAYFGWRRLGWTGGGDDTRYHKLLTFCIRSESEGPGNLRLMLRDDGGANYGMHNSQSSNQLPLAKYLPAVTKRYQCVAIPLADFILGAQAAPDRIRELVFIAPEGEKRSYDIDDVGLAVKRGPLLSGCEAVVAADGASVRLSARALSPAGKLQSVKAVCGEKDIQLLDDGQHGDGESGDGCYGALVPPAQIGAGTRTLRFVAADSDGAAEETAVAFLPPRAPGQIARVRDEGLKLDGKLDEFAAVTPFVIGGGKLELRARLLYNRNSLYAVVEVKDAAFDPQPPKKGQRKPPPEKLAETCSVELIITGPTTATCVARNTAGEADHRFIFVMDEKEGFALRGKDRQPAVGRRTEGGYTIAAQFYFDRLRTRREECDFAAGKYTRVEWRLIGADGTKLTWAARDIEACADPEHWGLARFTEEPGAPKIRYTRTDGTVLTLKSNKRLKAATAQQVSAYEVAGVRIEKVDAAKDGRTVRLTAAEPWKIGAGYILRPKGVQSEDGFAAESELAFTVLPGRPLNGELLQELLIGEVRNNVDMQCVTKAQIDEKVKPARGGQWRMAESEAGSFNLAQLVGDFGNTIVHAHAYLYADTERTVQVWIGSDDGERVVVNGAQVFTNPTQRGCQPDQDKIKGVKLKQGWNSLLVGIWNSAGDWRVSVRIMDENGNPPQGVSYSADSPFAPAAK